jgi:MFS family permease
LALYPFILSFAHGVELYLLANLVGGSAWALIGTVIYNYLLERVPAGDRPAYLAWYTLALNAAILIGALLGPVIAGQIGLSNSLLLF